MDWKDAFCESDIDDRGILEMLLDGRLEEAGGGWMVDDDFYGSFVVSRLLLLMVRLFGSIFSQPLSDF